MSARDRGIHADQVEIDLLAGRRLGDHPLHQRPEGPGRCPALERAVDGRPGAVLLRNVPPGAPGPEPPHHGVELPPQVRDRATLAHRQERLDQLPLGIREITTRHPRQLPGPDHRQRRIPETNDPNLKRTLDAPLYDGPRAQTTLERRHQIHALLDQGVGLLECARRLQLALDTVKRYARTDRPERMLRAPKYRAGLVDPYREHLRKCRTEDPAVSVQHLFEEKKALGFTGGLNLLHKYINQGRADADHSHLSARRLARMLLTRPDNLKAEYRDLLARLTAACPEMTQLDVFIG